MPQDKPLPLQVDGLYRFTLSSYDPVEIDIVVPQVTDYDVLIAVAGYLALAHASLSDFDQTWIDEHHREIGIDEPVAISEYLEMMRKAVTSAQRSFTEGKKPALCAQALADRLEQQVPPALVRGVEQGLLGALEAEKKASPQEFQQSLKLQQVSSAAELARMQAPQIAAQYAALDAYADHVRLEVKEDELAGLLRLAPQDARAAFQKVKAEGSYPALVAEARRNKCALALAETCACHYHEESAESADQRRRSYRELEQAEHIDLDAERRRLFGSQEGPAFRLV